MSIGKDIANLFKGLIVLFCIIILIAIGITIHVCKGKEASPIQPQITTTTQSTIPNSPPLSVDASQASKDIMDYDIVETDSIESLKQYVNQLIGAGYEPQGGAFVIQYGVGHQKYAQAVLKKR